MIFQHFNWRHLFSGNNGSIVTVTQTAIFNNVLYASCRDNGGLKFIDLDNPNKTDFSQWQTYTGNYYGVQAYLINFLLLSQTDLYMNWNKRI